MNTIQYFDAALFEPGDNTRKTFDPTEMAKLKESLRQYGMRRNVEAIQLPNGRLRLVTGERRWRATMELLNELTGDEREQHKMLATLLLTDAEVPEAKVLNIIENLQRDDVMPGEEAEGYHELLQSINVKTGAKWTVAEIAAAVKEEPEYVRRRLQLRSAPSFLLDAVNEKRVAASVAEIVGRIPLAAAREIAAKMILHPERQEVPLIYEQALEMIRRDFMVSLSKCGFSVEDETLVPVEFDDKGVRVRGGACESCPHRSGKALSPEELAGGNAGGGRGRKAGVDPNLCTLPECFRAKQDATWSVVRALAEGRGQKVIEGDGARRVFSGEKGELPRDSKYVDLAKKPGSDMAGSAADDLPAWKTLVNESDITVPVVIARHPITGRVHHLIAKSDAETVLKASHKTEEADAVLEQGSLQLNGGGGRDPLKEQQRKERQEKRLKREVLVDVFEELREAVIKRGVDDDGMMLAIEAALDAAADACRLIAEWMQVKVKATQSWRDYVQPILAHVRETWTTRPQLEAILHVALAAKDTSFRFAQTPALERFAANYRVDVAKVDARVRKAHELAGEEVPHEDAASAEEGDADPNDTPNLRDWAARPMPGVYKEHVSGDVEYGGVHVVKGESKPTAAKKTASKNSKPVPKPRIANKDAEQLAKGVYLKTGSITEAAESVSLTVNTVRKWHQRRGWKALRDKMLKVAKKKGAKA